VNRKFFIFYSLVLTVLTLSQIKLLNSGQSESAVPMDIQEAESKDTYEESAKKWIEKKGFDKEQLEEIDNTFKEMDSKLSDNPAEAQEQLTLFVARALKLKKSYGIDIMNIKSSNIKFIFALRRILRDILSGVLLYE